MISISQLRAVKWQLTAAQVILEQSGGFLHCPVSAAAAQLLKSIWPPSGHPSAALSQLLAPLNPGVQYRLPVCTLPWKLLQGKGKKGLRLSLPPSSTLAPRGPHLKLIFIVRNRCTLAAWLSDVHIFSQSLWDFNVIFLGSCLFDSQDGSKGLSPRRRASSCINSDITPPWG